MALAYEVILAAVYSHYQAEIRDQEMLYVKKRGEGICLASMISQYSAPDSPTSTATTSSLINV
eukprot:4583890-Amphidinium_carterae.3